MENDQQKFELKDLWIDCTKSAMNFWESSASTWQDFMTAAVGQQKRDNPLEAMTAMWKDLFDQEAMQNFSTAGTFADVAQKAANTFSEGYSKLQEVFTSMSGENGSFKDHSFIKAQQDLFQNWTDFHEKEIQPLLRIPQVGLTRLYQEKMNQLVDRFNLYQGAMADFQYLLCRPMESAMSVIQEQINKGQSGHQPIEFKEFYGTWIKALEQKYSELFTSAEWQQSLCRLVDEASAFRMSKNDILIDLIGFLPIPTNKDMDEVYKEIYLLKKTVKQLLKKIKEQELNAV